MLVYGSPIPGVRPWLGLVLAMHQKPELGYVQRCSQNPPNPHISPWLTSERDKGHGHVHGNDVGEGSFLPQHVTSSAQRAAQAPFQQEGAFQCQMCL